LLASASFETSNEILTGLCTFGFLILGLTGALAAVGVEIAGVLAAAGC
jgi:hypothetical protein